jgi:cold shock CspA family protein
MKEDIKFFNEHKGELFISPDLQLVRLIGVAEGKYITLSEDCSVSYCAVSEGLTILKNKIDNQDYNRFVQSYKTNDNIYLEHLESRCGYPKMYLEYRKEIESDLNKNHKLGFINLLTDIYFDLENV